MEDIVTIVQNLGFPIACCVALFYRMNKQDEMHKAEVKALQESLDKNTNILTRLYERLSGVHENGV